MKYMNIKNENEIKENLLNTNRDQYLNTYLVIDDEIIIKNRRLNYKNYKKQDEKRIRRQFTNNFNRSLYNIKN